MFVGRGAIAIVLLPPIRQTPAWKLFCSPPPKPNCNASDIRQQNASTSFAHEKKEQ